MPAPSFDADLYTDDALADPYPLYRRIRDLGPAVRNLIREAKLHQIPSAMQTGGSFGMQTMDVAVAELSKKGLLEVPAATLKPAAAGGA